MAKLGCYSQKSINIQYLLVFFSLFFVLRTSAIASETIHKPIVSSHKTQKTTNTKTHHYRAKNTNLTQSKLMPSGDISSKYNELSLNFGESNHPLIINALQFQGTQYKRGGQSPDTGFDCSGYVGFVFKESYGQNLPRRAAEMAKRGEPIDLHSLQAGDLVFFNTRKRSNSHVGIYLGNQEFIHAPTKGASVRINRLDERYWSKSYETARRYSPDNKQVM